MKVLIYIPAFLVAVLLSATHISAQISPAGRMDPDQLSKLEPQEPPADIARDRFFLHLALEANLGELEVSKLVVGKATNPQVKAFAQKLVDDHTQLDQALRPLGQAFVASIPKKLAKSDQAEIGKLNGLAGEAIEKEYIEYVVQTHKRDLQAFTTEAAATPDPNLGSAVQTGKAMIANHLDFAQKLSVKL